MTVGISNAGLICFYFNQPGGVPMRCLIIAMPLLAALALAGCNRETKEPKTAEQVKQQASAIVKPQPGQ